MTENEADVPYGEDFHDPVAAANWAQTAPKKRPWRTDFFRLFADAVSGSRLPAPRVLELGSGPGALAEFVLEHCPSVTDYTLLDFAHPMLELSRQRLLSARVRPHYVHANFKQPDWTGQLIGAFDFILTMQAVHELRHKRHAATLYAQVRSLLSPQGVFLACDHLPGEQPTAARRALFMTIDENLAALSAAGFASARCIENSHDMALFIAPVPQTLGG